jgi:hypothetical protein
MSRSDVLTSLPRYFTKTDWYICRHHQRLHVVMPQSVTWNSLIAGDGCHTCAESGTMRNRGELALVNCVSGGL